MRPPLYLATSALHLRYISLYLLQRGEVLDEAAAPPAEEGQLRQAEHACHVGGGAMGGGAIWAVVPYGRWCHGRWCHMGGAIWVVVPWAVVAWAVVPYAVVRCAMWWCHMGGGAMGGGAMWWWWHVTVPCERRAQVRCGAARRGAVRRGARVAWRGGTCAPAPQA